LSFKGTFVHTAIMAFFARFFFIDFMPVCQQLPSAELMLCQILANNTKHFWMAFVNPCRLKFAR